MAKKTNCPITRAEFREKAEAVEIMLNQGQMIAEAKEFSTGSLGWYLNGKTVVKVGDKNVQVQVGLNLTIIGSKELPMDEAAE
ncbi:MAG: hypothetical protein ACRDD1_13285 [Planctomycetia bacterium]